MIPKHKLLGIIKVKMQGSSEIEEHFSALLRELSELSHGKELSLFVLCRYQALQVEFVFRKSTG